MAQCRKSFSDTLSDTNAPGVSRNRARWDLHRHLSAEGRLNLLFRLSEPLASQLPHAKIPDRSSNVLPFISREEHLWWRAQWHGGRWVRLSWTTEERAAILRQDELFREADREWERRHPATSGPAAVIRFPPGDDYDFMAEAMRSMLDAPKKP